MILNNTENRFGETAFGENKYRGRKMSESKRRRLRRKRKIVRGARKTFINLIFAPLRMPRITGNMVSVLMKLCEGAALLFVFLLLTHIWSPDVMPTFIVTLTGVIFAGLLFVIKLSDYQEMIEQYKYYGFRI